MFYFPNIVLSHSTLLESLVSILTETKRTTKILHRLIIKSKHAITYEFKIALGYSVFSDVTLPSRGIKTFLSLEGSDANLLNYKNL